MRSPSPAVEHKEATRYTPTQTATGQRPVREMAGDGGVACADRPALSLLPRTFLSKKVATIASEGSEEQELQAIEDFFASAILGSSMASAKEAKYIPNGVGDPSKPHSEDGHSAGVANARDEVQGRRPALGRKRAHFSFNPNVSDSHLNMDLKSSVDHIEDPDELFSAFENIECARKELKKQMGEVALDSSPNVQWEAARKYRPGILGFEDIDKGEEIDFLQERLKIKSTNVEKISLPPLDGIRIKDVLKMGSKLAAENFGRSSTNRVSPTVASSPLAAISVLRRRISQLDPLQDPFSVLSSNEKPSPENSSPDEGSKERTLSSPLLEHPDVVGMEVENTSSLEHSAEARCMLSHKGKMQPTCTEADKIIPTNTPLGNSEDLHCPTNGITDHSAVHASAIDMTDAIGSTSFNSSCEDNASVVNMHIGAIPEKIDRDNEELPSGTPDGGSIGPSAGLCDRMDPDDGNPDNETSIDTFRNDCDNNGKEAPASGGRGQSSGNAASDIPNDECSGNSSASPEQNDKENQMDLTASINASLEVEAPRKRQNRQGRDAPRHSLAGLPTLVGVKYSSPAEDGRKQKQVLKIKSYVSEEYAGLVQKIALH
ncbi:hypothetical protein Taro_022336 [Colocasia esculenta]|uniref:Uncharacterized protein n=1 Tax=Colocasia esculenta TaxID=4460 RepID=A0A843UU48_COLES|nr:hypothetical protein [Colocasia esculenta]